MNLLVTGGATYVGNVDARHEITASDTRDRVRGRPHAPGCVPDPARTRRRVYL